MPYRIHIPLRFRMKAEYVVDLDPRMGLSHSETSTPVKIGFCLGMFAQWVMSIAILIVGFIVFCLRSFPGFYPLAMLGGAFWAIGE
ncbi:hypothetical protein TELCIR_08461 [Teladorsagia circumcincta]|uniref:Uncharacterized protein n=1 Tax=Teladorsagia circumcincta TaxID=45464 RepID=A0A2G9UHI7_TELCI|nr:hypothetical protein TELCIR_08461 [Teladorsagia circumcincta]